MGCSAMEFKACSTSTVATKWSTVNNIKLLLSSLYTVSSAFDSGTNMLYFFVFFVENIVVYLTGYAYSLSFTSKDSIRSAEQKY